MPGHIIAIECPCGYQTTAHPGVAVLDEQSELRVMVYSEDGEHIVTVPAKTAEWDQLIVIPDPALERPEELELTAVEFFANRRRARDGIHGDHICPRCNNYTLTLKHTGFWD